MRSGTSTLSSAIVLLACTVVLAGCAAAVNAPDAKAPDAKAPASQAASHTVAVPSPTYFDPIAVVPSPTVPSWFDVQMTDVTTGKQFKISDFSGKVILVDTMATWCPTCQGEMSQVQMLPTLLGSSSSDLVRITLDVDPNEDATILKKFAATNKFDWYIAVAPIEVGRFLETNYDQQYLNPPLQPMLFIDKIGGVYGLPFGIKSAESIGKTLASYLAQ